MFIDHQIGYLDIVKLCDACCEAHMNELVATPDLDQIVHYDQWVSVGVSMCGGGSRASYAVRLFTPASRQAGHVCRPQSLLCSCGDIPHLSAAAAAAVCCYCPAVQARRWVKEHVESGKYKPRLVMPLAAAAV